jgi:hypothetical protein
MELSNMKGNVEYTFAFLVQKGNRFDSYLPVVQNTIDSSGITKKPIVVENYQC